MAARTCIERIKAAAGRALSDDEVSEIFTRIHKAALDINAGRASPADIAAGRKIEKIAGKSADDLVRMAAERAAKELVHEADVKRLQANLQVLKVAARTNEVNGMINSGIKPIDSLKNAIARDYSGRTNIESLEQKVSGTRSYLMSKLEATWESLGNDFLGFFQNRNKLLNLIRELRGEDSGDALAAKGAKAFRDVAEEARVMFNQSGGDIGFLDDWGMPQHHSQELVASAGRDAWVDAVLPMLDKTRYLDDLGRPLSNLEVREFLGKAWDTIATNGHANHEPGRYSGAGKRANRHKEHRQIHFKDAGSVIKYWETFGERSAAEILMGHIESMARDIAFIDHFGPNPDITYQTLRDGAVARAAMAEPVKTKDFEGQANKLDHLWEYAAGKTKQSANLKVSGLADGIANINVASKLGGAVFASLFGDKPMMEAVAHQNNLPIIQRWRTELSLLNPVNKADRKLLQRQGLMLDSVRSGLNRFYEGLGKTGKTGKIANATMRVTGMQAINDIRKASFGLGLMDSIGTEIRKGVEFNSLPDSDVRALRNYGITESDWKVWRLSDLDDLGRGNDSVLTPESISRIADEKLINAGLADSQESAAKLRRDAMIKLMGAINTESEFAIVTPGWKERTEFYGDLQRGTVKGEIARSILQFKSFPWTYFKRGMDLVANTDGPASKAATVAYLIASSALAGAMILQTREMLSGKDPRKMMDEDWMKFWGAAFLQGGALGIYGDFLYSVDQTRYGYGPLEALSGPTIGPLLNMAVTTPLTELKKAIEGKETRFIEKQARNLKTFVPFGNMWFAKAAMERLVWDNVFEAMSPGYLDNLRSRSYRMHGTEWWWGPGDLLPERGPELEQAIER